MAIIDTIATTLHEVLTAVATTAARTTGLVQRVSTRNGAGFVQTLVCGYLAHPRVTLEALAQTAATLGISSTASGLFQRLGKPAADCLQPVLITAGRRVIAADPTAAPVLQHVTGVFIQDRSMLVVPPDRADVWHGCGGTTPHGAAVLKVQCHLNLLTGALAGLEWPHGRDSDRCSSVRGNPVLAGAVSRTDVGSFARGRFREIAAAGGLWLSHW